MIFFTEKKILMLKARLYWLSTIFIRMGFYNKAERFISLIARINYYFYLGYRDDELENLSCKLASSLINIQLGGSNEIKNTVMFYDAYGWANRGLTEQYLSSLIKYRKLIYIFDGDKKQPEKKILDILIQNDCHLLNIGNKTNIKNKVNALIELAKVIQPSMIFVHASPSSFTPFLIRKIFNQANLVNINITDHAYWLGYSIMDSVLEFRGYGASVSFYGRGIDSKKIFKIPFFPNIDVAQLNPVYFDFIKKDKLTLFTGGDLSKMNSKGHLFFNLMKGIVDRYENVQIIIAGGGDSSNLLKFIYDNRLEKKIEYIGFRNNIAEIMSSIDIYLSTYPIGGGLMNAYAISNKKPIMSFVEKGLPHTFIENNFDIEFRVSFANRNDFFEELDRLVDCEVYRQSEGCKLADYVSSRENFERLVHVFLENKLSTVSSIIQRDIELTVSKENVFDYESTTKGKFHKIFLKELGWLAMLFPFSFILSVYRFVF